MSDSIPPTKGLVAMRASDGDGRLTASLRTILQTGPRWESSRLLTSAAAACVAVLAVTGVVALSTSGSAAPRAKDVAATATKPTPTPHYLLPIAALVKDGSVPAPTLSGDNGTVGVPKGTAARPTKPVTTVNPGDITVYRGGSGTMTPAGIATLALERGCSSVQAVTATAIAMAESGGSPSAQGDVSLMDNVWDWSAGLWQIRGLRAQRGTGALRDSIANQQAATNSAAMYAISSGCTNWSPWTTYTRGLYLGYLGIAQEAVSYVVAYFQAHGHYPPVAAPDPNAVIPIPTGGGAVVAAPATAGRKPTTAPKPATPRTSAAPTPTRAAPTKSAGRAGSTPRAPQPTSATPTPTKSTPIRPTLPVPVPSTLPTVPQLPLPTITLPGL